MKLKRFLCMLLLCALVLPSMPALAIPVNEAPSEEEILETIDKSFVADTKIYTNDFQSGSFGGTSSNAPDKWNRAYQMSNSAIIDPKDPENYVGWVSMEGFLPAVNSSVAALVEANPSFEAWLKVLDSCQFYPTALDNWDAIKMGVINVEQNALTGGDVKTLLDELQASLTK